MTNIRKNQGVKGRGKGTDIIIEDTKVMNFIDLEEEEG